jgi:hypothetical protein
VGDAVRVNHQFVGFDQIFALAQNRDVEEPGVIGDCAIGVFLYVNPMQVQRESVPCVRSLNFSASSSVWRAVISMIDLRMDSLSHLGLLRVTLEAPCATMPVRCASYFSAIRKARCRAESEASPPMYAIGRFLYNGV